MYASSLPDIPSTCVTSKLRILWLCLAGLSEQAGHLCDSLRNSLIFCCAYTRLVDGYGVTNNDPSLFCLPLAISSAHLPKFGEAQVT